MTEPVATLPPLNEPLMTIEELAKWVILPEIPEDRKPFAYLVMEGAAVVVREAGSHAWAYRAPGAEPLPSGRIPVPYRAKLLYDLKVKNFFEHPTGAVSETVGPLSERFLDEVVEQLKLSSAEEVMLAGLVEDDDPSEEGFSTGLWSLSFTRGPLETHQRRGGVIHVPYWRPYSKAIPYYAEGALGSPW